MLYCSQFNDIIILFELLIDTGLIKKSISW